MTFEERKQELIVRQNALTNANVFWSKDENATEDKVIETAEKYAKWTLGNTTFSNLPPLEAVDEKRKEWLNFNTPDYNKAIDLKKKGYTVRDLRTQYKIGGAVAKELDKL